MLTYIHIQTDTCIHTYIHTLHTLHTYIHTYIHYIHIKHTHTWVRVQRQGFACGAGRAFGLRKNPWSSGDNVGNGDTNIYILYYISFGLRKSHWSSGGLEQWGDSVGGDGDLVHLGDSSNSMAHGYTHNAHTN